jgi:hypothetical protein
MTSMAREPLSLITMDGVPRRFDDACVQGLAYLVKLPTNADMEAFSKGVRNDARRYAQSVRVPTPNEVHREIEALEKAASRGRYQKVADFLESPSPAAQAARDWLSERLRTPAERLNMPTRRVTMLPDAGTLRNPSYQREACELIRQLCTRGGERQEGRVRPTGKRSCDTLRPLLYGPTPSPHFPRRAAELDLVMFLQMTVSRAGGKPALTARHRSDHADPGPFARMAQEVLYLVGAPERADAVGLINELDRRRRRKLLAAPLSTNNP